MIGEKKCTGCKNRRPFSAFKPNKETKDGLTYRCKQCLNREARERWNRPESKRKEAVRKGSPEVLARRRELYRQRKEAGEGREMTPVRKIQCARSAARRRIERAEAAIAAARRTIEECDRMLREWGYQ